MKIENAEVLVPVRAVHPTTEPRRPAPPESAVQPVEPTGTGSEAVQAASRSGQTDVQTYDRRGRASPSAARETAPPPDDRRLQNIAKLSSLWSEFRDAGIIPPPQTYAGLKVISPAELFDQEQPEETGSNISAVDELQMQLIRNLLRRMAAGAVNVEAVSGQTVS